MSELTRTDAMSRLFGYVRGFHATYLMDIGNRLGLFQALRGSLGMTPEELAQALKLDPFYITKWCETAYSLELLEHDPNAGFRLGPFIDDLLGNPEHTYFIGGFPNVHLLVAQDYAEYPERFRDGGKVPYQEHGSAFFAGVAEGTRSLPKMLLDAVVPKLPELERKLRAGGKLLDVGCGGGFAVCEFAERYPALSAVGIDIESESLRLAQQLVDQRGLGQRVRIEQPPEDGRARETFDFATMFLVLHEIAPEHKAKVLDGCAAALNPGGTLLILDECYPDSIEGLRDPTVAFSVMAQWFEMTWGNVINTRSEIRELLEGAGFSVLNETKLSRFYIVVAEKA